MSNIKYIVTFRLYDTDGEYAIINTSWHGFLNDMTGGFWINHAHDIVSNSSRVYWIPASQILAIEKRVRA